MRVRARVAVAVLIGLVSARAALALDPHRALTQYGHDVWRMAERAAAARPPGGYRFGLYFNCLARGRSLYGRDGVDSAALSRHLPGVPLLGFSCNAELAPLREGEGRM